MQNSKYVSHSPIDEHLKRAEPRTVSFPPFRGIGPPTHLLGVGRGNLTMYVPTSAKCTGIAICVGSQCIAQNLTTAIQGSAELWKSWREDANAGDLGLGALGRCGEGSPH